MENGGNKPIVHNSNNRVFDGSGGVYRYGEFDFKRSSDLAQTRRNGYTHTSNFIRFGANRRAIEAKRILSMKTVLFWLKIRRIWLVSCVSLWFVSAACFIALKTPKADEPAVSDANSKESTIPTKTKCHAETGIESKSSILEQ